MKKMLLVMVALWAMLASGCGTILNVSSGDLFPYGGVARDFAFIASATDSSTSSTSAGKGGAVALLILLPTEVSLSFFGDTVTLPLMLYLRSKVANYDSVDGHNDDPTEPAPAKPQENTHK